MNLWTRSSAFVTHECRDASSWRRWPLRLSRSPSEKHSSRSTTARKGGVGENNAGWLGPVGTECTWWGVWVQRDTNRGHRARRVDQRR